MIRSICAFGAAALLLTALAPSLTEPAWAQQAPAEMSDADIAAAQAAFADKMRSIADRLHPMTGSIKIARARAMLNLGEDYYYLPADEAKLILVEAWGNPPSSVTDVLGMVFPAGKTFTDNTWGAVITYEPIGYVSDDDADDIDYDQMMVDLKNAQIEENRSRAAAGYPGHNLHGWAQEPTYDAKRHSMIWAQNFRVDGEVMDTLNYDVRLLGRYGVLSLNMISVMPDLPDVRAAAASFGKSAEFDRGSRYADFNSATDQVSEYGLAGLVAGGIGVAAAKKVGLLGGIGAVLLGLKKLLIPLVLGIGAFFTWLGRLIFGRKEEEYYEEYVEDEPAEEEPNP